MDGAPVRGGILLTIVGDLAAAHAGEWRAGRTIRAPTELRRPSRYLNPGVPDEERSLARRGTSLVGTVKSALLVEVVQDGTPLAEAAASVRAFVRHATATYVGRWSARSAGIVTAIVIGDRSGLDDGVQQSLQDAGTYHVVAISGGNIAIIAAVMLVAFRVTGVLGRTAMLTAVVALVAYGYLVGAGGGASVERATLMAVMYFAARLLDLRGPPANALAVAAGLLVVVQPLASADPAFLLTCGATAGILAILPVARAVRCPRLTRPLLTLCAASVAAEAALMPIGALIFSRVTFAGLILNFAAIPLMAVVQMAGMAVVPAALLLPPVAPFVGWVAYMAAEGLVESANVPEFTNMLVWRVTRPGWIVLAVYYVAAITFGLLWYRRPSAAIARDRRILTRSRQTAGVVALTAAVWIVAEPWTFLAARADGRLRLTFLDVRQGDAILVRFPAGATLLVDGGGQAFGSSFDIGDRIVAPVLRGMGIRRLDSIAISHAHPDHIGGLPSLIEEFRPREIWEGIPVPALEPLKALQSLAETVGARWVSVQSGDRVRVDGVDVVVHHPGLPDWERQQVRNDDSIVLELRWRDVSVVLTGDIGREVEDAILSRFAPARLRVVKVPHHGSLTSSSAALLERLAPSVAVVSAGRGNMFGHPAPAVIDRYKKLAARLFRTDEDGAVAIESDGYSLTVSTFTGRTLTMP
jgi:competence protein ComEC